MDDEDPRPRKALFASPALDDLSIEELKNYISDLEGEIARVNGEIDKKNRHRAGVEGLFKGKS